MAMLNNQRVMRRPPCHKLPMRDGRKNKIVTGKSDWQVIGDAPNGYGDVTAVDVKKQSIILAFSAMVWLLPDNKDSWLSCKAVNSSEATMVLLLTSGI